MQVRCWGPAGARVLTVFGGLQQLASVVQVRPQAPGICLVQVGQLLDQPALVIIVLACRCPQARASRRGTLGIKEKHTEHQGGAHCAGPWPWVKAAHPGRWQVHGHQRRQPHMVGPFLLLSTLCVVRWHGVLED